MTFPRVKCGATWFAFGALAPGVCGCSDDSAVGFPTASDQGSGVSFPSPDAGVGTGALKPTVALWGEVKDSEARPMVTGTLAVTADGAYAVASDSERDVMYVVNLATRSALRVRLNAGDEPGRTVAGRIADGVPHVYTVLRRRNLVLDLNVVTSTLNEIPTCEAPRGITYVERDGAVHVVCANGELVTYDAATWSEIRRVTLVRDLRDVEAYGDDLLVSRFSSAEVLVVDAEGGVRQRQAPQALPDCAQTTVAYRLAVNDNNVYLAHQLATTEVVQRANVSGCAVPHVATVVTREPVDKFLDPSHDGWSQLSSIQVDANNGGVNLDAENSGFAAALSGSAGPLDLAIGADGRVVLSLAGNYWLDQLPTIVSLEPSHERAGTWRKGLLSFRPAGMISSIAVDPDGRWIALSREPAALYFEAQAPLFLGGESVDNTAFSLLHMNTGAGVACVSCHPEGGHDDHVWRFPQATRVTLPLGPSSAPFYWDHSISDITTLLDQKLHQHMAYELPILREQALVVEDWLRDIPRTTPRPPIDPAVEERGARVFESALSGCAGCHAGEKYTDGQVYNVGTGGSFATPSLLGLGARSHFLHDGCAASVEEVFGACGGGSSHELHGKISGEQVTDLLAFLSSL